MSDEILKSGEDDKGPVGGERLRVARRANDISVRDVAKELHLDESKVRALEKNEFAVLGAPVFAKGHLRKYAELVGVPVDDVMTDYYEMTRAAGIPPVIGPRKKRPRDINAGPWLGAAVVILLIAAAVYWWFNLRQPDMAGSRPATPAPFVTDSRDQATTRSPATPAAAGNVPADGPAATEQQPPASTPVTPQASTAAPQPSGATPQAATATQRPSTATPQPSAAQAAPATASPARTETPVDTSPAAPQLVIELTYSGDCWTEASDASGRRLFYDLGVAGRTVRLSGVAPVRLILGDSGNVSITVDGRPYNIPASARSGRLARLTISAR